jgi:hypothetical protein
VRAWRGVMMEWLSLLAASKAAKRVPRCVCCCFVAWAWFYRLHTALSAHCFVCTLLWKEGVQLW